MSGQPTVAKRAAGSIAATREGLTGRVCSTCVLDGSVPDILFDEFGECQYCKAYRERSSTELHNDETGRAALAAFVGRLKSAARRKNHDCVIGLSGGVDSTYVAYLLRREFELRPLAVHLDNGWDDELAVANIERTVTRLGIDLHTIVLDWEDFKSLQVAFLRSSLANAEIPTDHAIVSSLFRVASQEGTRYIISGSNIVTEAVMPPSWMEDATDYRLIAAVNRRFGTRRLRDYPRTPALRFAYYVLAKRMRFFPILNYVDYNKARAKELLKEKIGWRDYGGKHYESRFTKFFQGFLLPNKFNIDKRKAHYSNLILSGQMTREAALRQLETPPWAEFDVTTEKAFFLKKLGLREEDLAHILTTPRRSTSSFPNNEWLFGLFEKIVASARRRAISPAT
jgi:N-acetyl sugar amidotransferase